MDDGLNIKNEIIKEHKEDCRYLYDLGDGESLSKHTK